MSRRVERCTVDIDTQRHVLEQFLSIRMAAQLQTLSVS